MTNPNPVPAHLAGVTVYLENVDEGRLHITLYQTGPAALDPEQAVAMLEAAVEIARQQLLPEQKATPS